MKDKAVLSNKQKRAAKKLFAKKPHTTRAFTSADFTALPKGGNNA